MRLHHLSVEAFGPFAERIDIDLDQVGESGLFLIHGPTGSGKTSLLDAVCFALYGTVPGARQQARSLPSHHADPSVVPTVELELTAAGRRLRITRSPEFARPKKRGGGTTKVPARVLLTELVDGEWVDRGSGRHVDVADIVSDILGLDARQFQTVVLLPQGDFASFLRADTAERVGVLSKLFDTRRFDDVTAWLEERRRQTEQNVVRGRAELALALTRAADAVEAIPDSATAVSARQTTFDLFGEEALTGTDSNAARATGPAQPSVAAPLGLAGAGRPVVDRTTQDPALVGPMLAGAGSAARDILGGTRQRVVAASAHARAATRAREHGERTARIRENAVRAQAQVASLRAAEPEIAVARTRLSTARRASAVQGHLEAVSAARLASSEARSAMLGLDEELAAPGAATSRAAALSSFDDVVATIRGLAERVHGLERMVERTTGACQSVDDSLRGAEDAHRVAVERAAAAAAEVAESTGLAALEPGARRLVLLLDQCVDERAALLRAGSDVQDAEAEVDRTGILVRQAQTDAARLGGLRAQGLAAELALSLTEGDPCPVCGSVDHPSPADADGQEIVTADQVAAAEELLAERRALASAATAALAGARATFAERQASAARSISALADDPELPDVDRDSLQEDTSLDRLRREAVRTHREAAAARDTLAVAAAAHEAAADDVSGAASRLSAAKELSIARAAEREAALAAAADARAALDEALAAHDECPCGAPRSLPSIAGDTDASPATAATRLAEAVVSTHRRQTQHAEAAVRAHDRAAQLADQLEVAEERLRVALGEQGLHDEASARESLLEAAGLDTIAERITRHESALAAAESLLQQEEVLAALAAAEPDVELLLDAEQRASSSLQALERVLGVVEHAVDVLGQATEQALATVDRLGPALEDAAVVREVADTVAGSGQNNALRMSLTTFVLAARLEEVVRLANERLAVMTAGRYELRHTDELAARGKRSGLGLEVVDAWSGRSRDTKSLSGGETFMASLALALGLGDAVRAESGGLELETLFVDEGFGTLDEESLEQVMDVLDGLRAGGRSVGVVSHVAELRQRIPSQLRLTRTPRGSRVEVRTEGDLG